MIRWFCAMILAAPLAAETGYSAWLRYAAMDEASGRQIPAVIVTAGESPVMGSARAELIRGVRGMFGRTLRIERALPAESAILAGPIEDLRKLAPQLRLDGALAPDAFWLKTARVGAVRYLVIAGGNDRGALYGAFALLRKMATGELLAEMDEKQAPYAPVRWVNQWDNLDGTIERGYGGRSVFWEGGHVRADMKRVSDYGRLRRWGSMASPSTT
jgi:alpha-glucuronidase